MHKQLQQLRETFITNGQTWLAAAYLFFLPLYIGEIVYDKPAYLFGHYFNYLHIRITVHLILSVAIVGWWFFGKNRVEKRKMVSYVVLGLALLALLWYVPISRLALQAEVAFLPIYFSSLFHVVELFLATGAICIVSASILTEKTEKNAALYRNAVLTSVAIQALFAFAQYMSKGPFYPELFTWIGQPLRFTSDSVLGMLRYPRVYGTTPHPNILAAIMNFFAILTLHLNHQHSRKITSYFVLILITIVAALTLSKLGIVALLAIFALYLLRKVCTRIRFSKYQGYLLILLLTLTPIALASLSSIFQTPLPFAVYRGQLIHTYGELVLAYPFLLVTGTGYQISSPILLQHSALLSQNVFLGNGLTVEPIHNLLLLTLLEFGIPVSVLFGFQVFSKAGVMLTTFVRKLSEDSKWFLYALMILLFLFGGFDHLLLY